MMQEGRQNMSEEFKVNDQVVAKRKIRSGNLVRIGSIVKLDGEKARVHFPVDNTQVVIPVNQLEKTSTKFGTYTRVQPSAMRRSFSTLQDWLRR